MDEREKNELAVVLDTFYNTLEPLEEYIGKTNHYLDWGEKRQIYRKSIADSNSTAEVFEDIFLTDLYITLASVNKKDEPFRKKIQEEYFKWINAVGIDTNNCPKKLKHYLFEINEILEGRWENFAKQMKEKITRIEKENPIDLHNPEDRKLLINIFSGVQRELNHPRERKKIDIKGDVKVGKETLQQIAWEIADEHQNFRFFPQKEEQQAKENTAKSQPPAANQVHNEGSTKATILSIFLISSFILFGCLLFWRKSKRERERERERRRQWRSPK